MDHLEQWQRGIQICLIVSFMLFLGFLMSAMAAVVIVTIGEYILDIDSNDYKNYIEFLTFILTIYIAPTMVAHINFDEK